MGRLVLFDRRGIGLSDPVIDWSRPLVEQWADDLTAVVATACTGAPVVIAFTDNWGPARLFAARHPDAVSSLVLYEPQGPLVTAHLISRSIACSSSRLASALAGNWMPMS